MMAQKEISLKLKPGYVDCSTAMMLKVLDETCQMSDSEKQAIEKIYEQVKGQRGSLLGHQQHDLIILGCMARCEGRMCDEMAELIHEQRVMSEEKISAPVWDAFTAMMRHKGFFPAQTLSACQ